jgi:hypothetical protein
MIRNCFLFLFCFLLVASQALAGIVLNEPKDKLITFDEVVWLRGRGRDLEILKVNDQELKFNSDGSFACGLVLRPGKNFIEVRALDQSKEHFTKTLRILRLKAFPDIDALYEGKKHWARTQILHTATLGIIEGYPDDDFYPGNPITRSELATWIARAKKLPVPVVTEDVFFDVPKEHWRAPYIKAVVDAGFIRPYDQKNFGPDDPISRRQAAEVAVLTEGYTVVEKIKPLFIDVPKEEKGAFPIYVAKEKGLVMGVSKDIAVFDPDRALTRAEAAVLASRFKRSIDHIRNLFDFEKGYSQSVFCRLNIPPEIISFTTGPDSLSRRQKSIIRLRLEVAVREGFYPMSKVKVDLSALGGMPDAEMYDDGTHGDEQKEDLIYSLNVTVEPAEMGMKRLTGTAIDRFGWETKRETSLLVLD